jgi:CRISPR-associated endoribonuclease Cas6
MISKYLHSLILELNATSNIELPATTGHQAHALFLDLVQRIDPALSARLHNEENYRPFTVSPLRSANERERRLFVRAGALYILRVTLLDGGHLWQCLSHYLLESRDIPLQIGEATFTLTRVISTPSNDPTGWAGHTDWQTLAATPAQEILTFRFASPTAFSMGNRRFTLFPEPLLVWDGLLRTWNRYAPEILHLDKPTIREFVTQHVAVVDYHLQTTTLHFPHSIQKGFIGTCTYSIQQGNEQALPIAVLASFARFAGIGSKTTMGMGQARLEESAWRREIAQPSD